MSLIYRILESLDAAVWQVFLIVMDRSLSYQSAQQLKEEMAVQSDVEEHIVPAFSAQTVIMNEDRTAIGFIRNYISILLNNINDVI